MQKAPQIRSAVDVIVPCYNVESYLPRALESVFSQTFADFQVLAVDDGSTDHTLNVLRRHAQRCSWVSQPHRGAAAARNCAIGMSNSPLVAFLDADDQWLPHKLERQVEFMTGNPDFGMVCSLCLTSQLQRDAMPVFSPRDQPLSGRLFAHLVRNCFVFTPTVLVRRRCLEEVGLFDESLLVSEDFHLWLRIAARWKIALLREVLAITHARPDSLSATISPDQRLQTGVAALESVRASCRELSVADARALRHALAQRYYFYGSFLLSSGVNRRCCRSFLTALRLQPTNFRAVAKLALRALPARAIRSALAFIKLLKHRPLAHSASPSAVRNSGSQ